MLLLILQFCVFAPTSETYKCDVATDEVDDVFCRTFAMENKTRGRTLNHQLKNLKNEQRVGKFPSRDVL